ISQQKEDLKGLKGEDARAARMTLNSMEKELRNLQKVLDATEARVKLATPTANQLKKAIATQIWYKGIGTEQYREIKWRVTGLKSLTEMTEVQLQDVLDALIKTRPVKIKNKIVITQSTENKIQQLNQVLLDKGKITPTTLSELQHYLKLPTDRYISGR
ncbi:MAG: regulatory protein GemA, partial [Dehalococcoidales bacterium]|nr:regulatory protein GemA [Dehalococcoidales bacterium]